MIPTAPAPRTVYIAQSFTKDAFDVAFNCLPDVFPWHEPKARTYRHITRASLERINRLVYQPLFGRRFIVPLSFIVHLNPYLTMWVSFPTKGKIS